MSNPKLQEIENYFFPNRPTFWRWSGNCCAEIEFSSIGSILIFRSELKLILEGLAEDGWPPLSTILLVCAASLDTWPDNRKWLAHEFKSDARNAAQYTEQLLEGLDRIHKLPLEDRRTPAAKTRLLRMILEGKQPWISPAHTLVGLHFLESVIPHRDPRSFESLNQSSADRVRLIEETYALRHGLQRISPAAIISRVLTGLEQSVVAAPIEPPKDAETHAGRLTDWLADPELFAVARIARRLLSVLTWPRALSDPDDIPQGGVSDLTNRGPLDRLLLSELAHDDDTLAVRVALNEALYLRRESPAQRPPRHRAIFVDTGVRLWGRPRVYAAAVALALAASEDHEPELSVTVDVADDLKYATAEITTRAGVQSLLTRLAPTLHPGDVLTKWSADQIDDHCDPVLITNSATIAQPEFQAKLDQLGDEFYIALVETNGQFELRHRTVHGWRSISKAQLDLDELLTPPEQSQPISITAPGADRIPAIFRVDRFPLRLTHSVENERCWPVSRYRALSFASSGRIMLWSPGCGALQLAIGQPIGRVVTWRNDPEFDTLKNPGIPTLSQSHVLIYNNGWHVLTICLQSGMTNHCELKTELPGNITRGLITSDCVYLIGRRTIQAFSPSTGVKLAETSSSIVSSLTFLGNRFLRSREGWVRLSFDGQIHLKEIDAPRNANLLVDAWDVLGKPEPIALPQMCGQTFGKEVPKYDETTVSGTQLGSLVILNGSIRSLNGENTRYVQSSAVWDLEAPHWHWNSHSPPVEAAVGSYVRNHLQIRQTLRHKFVAISCGPQGVFLQSGSRNWWRVSCDQQRLRMTLDQKYTGSSWIIRFERLRESRTHVPILQAMLPNGTVVWLDERGLLHLMPADTKKPDVTLALDENNLSGWTSEGFVFGDDYFIHTAPFASVNKVHISTAWQNWVLTALGAHQ